MAMVQCPNGHLYDDRKHTHCPHCPVPGLRDVGIPGTQAAPMSRLGVPQPSPHQCGAVRLQAGAAEAPTAVAACQV